MSLFDDPNCIYNEQKAFYKHAGIRDEKMQHAVRWWHLMSNNCKGQSVTFLDEFQSFSDFQNDVAGLIITPLACYFLSWYHTGRLFYELALGAIHLITLNPTEAGKHFGECLTSLVSIFYYNIQFYVEIITQALSLAIRCAVTVGYGLYHGGVAVVGLFGQGTGAGSSGGIEHEETVDYSYV